MMKEREREREKRLSPLLFRLPESRTDEQSSGALKGQRPGPTGALRVSLFFSSLSLSLAALYNIACVYIYIPTFVGRRKICEKKGKAAHTNTEEKKKERERERKKDRVPAKYIEYNELSALERIFLSLSKGVKGQWLGAAGNSTTTRKNKCYFFSSCSFSPLFFFSSSCFVPACRRQVSSRFPQKLSCRFSPSAILFWRYPKNLTLARLSLSPTF